MTLYTLAAAMIAIPLFVVGFMVSLQRGKTNIMTGGNDDPTSMLNKSMRSHGNQAEWAGVLVAMILYLGTTDQAAWVGWVAITVAVGRVLHAIGFLVCKTLERPHPLKAIGALITYVGGIILAVTLVTGSAQIADGLSGGLGRDLDSTLSASDQDGNGQDQSQQSDPASSSRDAAQDGTEKPAAKSFVDALDENDLAALAKVLQTTLETTPSGQSKTWRNSKTGVSGTVTPQPAYKDASGRFCREFNITARANGREESFYGTACRYPDGAWRRLS